MTYGIRICCKAYQRLLSRALYILKKKKDIGGTLSKIEAIGSSGATHAGSLGANFIAEVPSLKRHPQPVSPHSGISHRRIAAAGSRRNTNNTKQ